MADKEGIGLGSLIGIGSSLIGGLFGLGQKLSARKLEKKNIMPTYNVSERLANNYAQAQNMAKIGIAQQQYNNVINQQDQNLANVLSTASRSGRNIGTAGILRQANQATMNLNAQDAVARQQNQRFAMQQNGILAQEERNAWQWNSAQPYLRTAQQVASLRNAGNQNIFGALGNVSQIGMMSGFDGSGSSASQADGQITNFLPNATLNTNSYNTGRFGSQNMWYKGQNLGAKFGNF